MLFLWWAAPLVLAIVATLVGLKVKAFTNQSSYEWTLRKCCFVWFTAFALAFAVMGGTINITRATSVRACQREGHAGGFQSNSTAIGGCYLKINGQWVPDSKWRVNTGK